MKDFSEWARLKEGMYDYVSDSKYHDHYEALRDFLQNLASDFWADRNSQETEEAYLGRMIQFVRGLHNAAGANGKAEIRKFLGSLTQKQKQAQQQQAQQQQPQQQQPQQDDLRDYQASRKAKQAYDNLPWYKRMFTQPPQ